MYQKIKNNTEHNSTRSNKAVLLTSIYGYHGDEPQKNLQRQEAALLAFCRERNIMPIRRFRENHLGLQGERPIIRSLKRFLQNNNQGIDMLVFPCFHIFCGNDQEIIDHVLEFSYMHIQLVSVNGKLLSKK